MNFEDVREYQPGDEIRAIDWNVTARLGTAFVKKFTEERELTVMLIVDVRRPEILAAPSIETRAGCGSRLSARFQRDPQQRQGRPDSFTDRVELFIPPKKGRSHTLRLIREILFFEPAVAGLIPRLHSIFKQSRDSARGRVFHFRFSSAGFSHTLAVSGRRHDFIAVHIQDEREQVLPTSISPSRMQRLASKSKSIPRIAARERGFNDLATEKAHELSRTLRRNNIDAITLRTSEDYLPALRAFF